MPTDTKNLAPTITAIEDWQDELTLIGADVPTMPGTGPTIDDIEAEMLTMPHLTDDLRVEADRGVEHFCRDARGARSAIEHIGRLPDAFEAFHLLAAGKYALWNMVPAILELAAPVTIAALHIATLGFSKNNIAEMMELFDAGKINAITLLCSHFFKGTSGGIWDYAAAEFAKRPAARFLSIRTHCKLIAAKFTDGRTVTIESSANLRSCKNIKQLTIYGMPNIYDFHVGWIDELFRAGGGHA